MSKHISIWFSECHWVTFKKHVEFFSYKNNNYYNSYVYFTKALKKSVYLVDMITRNRIIWNKKTKKIPLVDDFVLCLNEEFKKILNF